MGEICILLISQSRIQKHKEVRYLAKVTQQIDEISIQLFWCQKALYKCLFCYLLARPALYCWISTNTLYTKKHFSYFLASRGLIPLKKKQCKPLPTFTYIIHTHRHTHIGLYVCKCTVLLQNYPVWILIFKILMLRISQYHLIIFFKWELKIIHGGSCL